MANISDEDKLSIIMPAAEILKAKHQEKIRAMFHQFTGALANSITIFTRTDADGVEAVITPTGKHPGSKMGKRMKKEKNGKRRSSGKYSGSNAEIAYILEYGSPRIGATHWMESANEEAEDEVIDAMQDSWNELLKRKGF